MKLHVKTLLANCVLMLNKHNAIYVIGFGKTIPVRTRIEIHFIAY